MYKLTDMRKLFVLLLMPMLLTVSCSKFDYTPIWDKLNDHESRISVLEEMCRKMNTNIDALQIMVEALQNNECVVSVAPIIEDRTEVGYTIKFTSGKTITIYQGKDGYTPNIGVKQDADGVYYWTIDGSWLLDGTGQKVNVVGINGQNGQNGVTPQLKIENGMWYVSYNNGVIWTELGQATGDQGLQGNTGATGPQGPQGTPGIDGDAFFLSVTETKEYVSLVLSDSTEIKIPKYSADAATLTFDNVTGNTVTFNGQVIRRSLDLKVTIYYSTTENLTIYKYRGKTSVTEFDGDAFTIKLSDLAANTTYYYFSEVISNGIAVFSEIGSFRTVDPDSYIDWGEGENVGGDI